MNNAKCCISTWHISTSLVRGFPFICAALRISSHASSVLSLAINQRADFGNTLKNAEKTKLVRWPAWHFTAWTMPALHTPSNLGHSASHSPDVEEEEEARCRDSQLQFTPVSYEVRHPGQQNVAEAKEVVSDYTSQHPLLRPCPLRACMRHRQGGDTWIISSSLRTK